MTETGVTVERATVADHELLDAIKALLPQLSSSAPPPTFAELDEVVDLAGDDALRRPERRWSDRRRR